MKNIPILLLLLCLIGVGINAQTTVRQLYNDENYEAIIAMKYDSEKLSADELYMVGYAFFRTAKDSMAIGFYDKAMSKGFDTASIYFYKGLSYCYLKNYKEALPLVEIALKKAPDNQEFMNQKGKILRNLNQKEAALTCFVEATKMENTFGEPFYWVARYYHEKEDFKKALEFYYEASSKVPKGNIYYNTTLESIGQLEYTFAKNPKKSAQAYSQAIALDLKNYRLYPKQIKAFNAAKEYAKADSTFVVLRVAYNNKELPETEMKYKDVAIDEYEWKG